jgi:hypothetical protein
MLEDGADGLLVDGARGVRTVRVADLPDERDTRVFIQPPYEHRDARVRALRHTRF